MYSIIASNSRTSINQSVAEKINEKLDLNIIEVNGDEIPLYSPQLEAEGFPSEIKRIYDLIRSDTKFIIFTPEYNGYTTAYFKNILDWLSRIEHRFLEDIDVKIISVSPGRTGGASVRKALSDTMPFFGAKSVETYGFANYYTKVEEETFNEDLENILKLIKG